jgi:hypothetical protein
MTDEWNPELQELADTYSPGYVITAFAVREKLDEEGYEGIHFTETTESYMKQMGKTWIKSKVEKHMNRQLRQAGLK